MRGGRPPPSLSWTVNGSAGYNYTIFTILTIIIIANVIIHHPHYDHHCPGLFNTNNGSAGYENTIINILTIIIIVTVLDP